MSLKKMVKWNLEVIKQNPYLNGKRALGKALFDQDSYHVEM
ncbi:hypothetical protein [Bacillus mycoides]